MSKKLLIESCHECPFYGECEAWKSLTKSQRVQLAIENITPKNFILAKCDLKDSEG